MSTKEILDKVYNTFRNLDRDFKHSKKSRSQFLLDKFGGDLEIGSTLILEAINNSSEEYTTEEIGKLSFIKDIFTKIKDTRESWDQLPDFSFQAANQFLEFLDLLDKSFIAGTGVVLCTQSDIYRQSKGNVHFLIKGDNVQYCPISKGNVVHVYNHQLSSLLSEIYATEINVNSYYRSVFGGGLEEVQKIMVGKAVNS